MRASTLYVNLDRDVTTGLSYLDVKLFVIAIINLFPLIYWQWRRFLGVIKPLGEELVFVVSGEVAYILFFEIMCKIGQ